MDGRKTIPVPKGPRLTESWPYPRVSIFHRGEERGTLKMGKRIEGYLSGDSGPISQPNQQLQDVILTGLEGHGSRGGSVLKVRGKLPGEVAWDARKSHALKGSKINNWTSKHSDNEP